MLVLLAAWLFWLALNGRLGTYAAFATTAGSGSGGGIFANFSIPISLFGSSATPGTVGNTLGVAPPGTTTGQDKGMPSYTGYQASLPATDTGTTAGLLSSLFTGFYPSGLPNYGTLNSLNNQAIGNVAGGAAGL